VLNIELGYLAIRFSRRELACRPANADQMKSGSIVGGRMSQAGTGRFFSRRKAGL
jgi:hypothetical protein